MVTHGVRQGHGNRHVSAPLRVGSVCDTPYAAATFRAVWERCFSISLLSSARKCSVVVLSRWLVAYILSFSQHQIALHGVLRRIRTPRALLAFACFLQPCWAGPMHPEAYQQHRGLSCAALSASLAGSRPASVRAFHFRVAQQKPH